MRAITLTTEIGRSRDDVFAYLADLANLAEWTGVVKACELSAGTPGTKGATYRQVLDIAGQDYDGGIELTRLTPGRTIVTVARVGPVKLTTTFDLADVGAGAATALTMTIDPGITGAPMAPMFRAGGEVDIKTLKDVLEG